MASSMTRFRLHHLGNIRVSRLLAPLVTLVVLYAIYRLTKSPSLGIIHSKKEHFIPKMNQNEIQEYINALQDTRPQGCRRSYRDDLRDMKGSVSLVVTFHGEELYNLKLTLSSIIEYTPEELYSEIVVLDDGTENFEIRQHAADFLKNEKFGSKVRPFRSPKTRGSGASRFKASLVAKGDIVVFVDSSTVVNNGWLEPLLLALRDKETLIVVPHSDNFLSEKRFFQMEDSLVTTFSWPLSIVYMASSEKNTEYLKTPVMRGDVVAMHNQFLKDIGNYDDGMGTGGGENLELSLRTWMCGGEIQVSLCSRIATHSALKPIDVTSQDATKRIAELWLDEYKDITYKQAESDGVMSEKQKESFMTRKSMFKKTIQCKSFEWYLNTIAKDTIAPSDSMRQYGKLQASSGYCINGESGTNNDVFLVLCRPYMYNSAMMFEYDKNGYLRIGDQCLLASGVSSRIMLTSCSEDNVLQVWKYLEGEFRTGSFPGSCLTHVTETENTGNIHYKHHLNLEKCREKGDPKQMWTFIRY